MKPKILKLCSIVLLLLFIGAGCQKDDWENVELNNISCLENTIEYLQATNELGIIRKSYFDSSLYIEVLEYDGSALPDNLRPCNISGDILFEGASIVFTGMVYRYKESEKEDSTAVDYWAFPIFLSNAKIKK